MAQGIQAGDIMWLKRNAETEALSLMETGALDHPVLVLGNSKGQRPAGVGSERNLQIVIITSFGKKLLSERFPKDVPPHRKERSNYVPIYRPPHPRIPHPDSGLVLDVEITGTPRAPKDDRVSYVTLKVPYYVKKEHLSTLGNGTARLTYKSLDYVVGRINAKCRKAKVPLAQVPREPPPVRVPSPEPVYEWLAEEVYATPSGSGYAHRQIPVHDDLVYSAAQSVTAERTYNEALVSPVLPSRPSAYSGPRPTYTPAPTVKAPKPKPKSPIPVPPRPVQPPRQLPRTYSGATHTTTYGTWDTEAQQYRRNWAYSSARNDPSPAWNSGGDSAVSCKPGASIVALTVLGGMLFYAWNAVQKWYEG